MTGSTDANTAKKLRAIVLAFVMVASVFTATVAFSGGAAAAPPGNINAGNTAASDFAGSGTDTAHTITADFTGAGNVGQIQLEYENGNNFEDDGGSLDNVEQEDVSVDIDGAGQSIDGIEKTDADSDGNSNVLTITLGSATSVNPDGSPDTTVTVNDVTVPDGSNNDYQLDFEIDDTLNGGGANNFNSELNQDGLAFTAFQSSASGAPQILSVSKTGSSELTITTSEGVTDGNDNPLADVDLSYGDVSSGGSSSISSVNHVAGTSTITVTTNNALLSSDIGADEVSLTSSVNDLDDNSASQNFQTIQSPLSGDANTEISTDIGGSATQNIRAGSSGQSLDLIRIKDISNADSPLAERTILRMPDGVTINETETDLVVTTTSGNLEATGTEIVDESTLRINHSGSSDSSQSLRISGLVVDTASDIDASQGGTVSDIEVDYAIGNLDTALLTVEKPQILTDGSETVSAGTNGQDLTDNIGDIRVQTGSNVDGQIANQSDIVINANASNGITFDTDIDPTTLTATTTGNAEVDISSATLTEDALTIPVTARFNAGDRVDIDTDAGDDLLVDVAGDAENAKFSGTVVANSSTGDITLEQSTQTNDLNVQNPDISIDPNNQNLAVGLNEQILNEGGLDENAAAIAIEDTSGDQMAAGENVTIQLNSSDVTFDTSRATQLDTGNNGDGVDTALGDISDDGTLDAAIDDGGDGNIIVDAVTINENSIEVSLADNGETATDNGDILELGDVGLNVSTTAGDEADVEFEAVTRSGAAAPDVVSTSTAAKNSNAPEAGQFLTLNRPRFELSGNNDQTVQTGNSGNITLNLDGDGFTGQKATGTDDALVLDQDSIPGMIADTTNVTVTLEDRTGVTFDTSASTDSGFDTGDSEVSAQVTNPDDITVTNVDISEKSLTVELDDDQSGQGQGADAQLDGGSAIAIDSFILNATGSAQTTEISVTTNATVSSPDGTDVTSDVGTSGTFTSTANNEVTTTLSNVIEFDAVEPSQIRVDPDTDTSGFNPGSFTFGADQQVDKPQVTNTISSGLEVQDGGSGFGDATVNLEIIETPDGASGAQLNTTQLSTNSNGNAFFNFTAGNTTGDYVVNATVESTGAGVNITYTAQPGDVAGLSATLIENAIAGGGSDVGTASLFVNATDANGNAVEESATVSLTANNVGADGVAAFDDKASDGTGDTQTDNLQDGQFSLDNGDGSSVIEVTSSQVENVTITVETSGESDDVTVTFFDQVGGIDLSLNETSAAVGDTVSADATITEGDGRTIEVPDVNVDFEDNNNGNTTFGGGADSDSATTNTNGIASVSVIAEQTGTSTIDASSNLRTDSATLTIEEQQEEPPTASITFDDQTFQNGSTSSVNVASATFNGSEDFVIVVHQASPGDNDVVDNTTEINGKIGSSDVLTNNTVSDVPVDLTKNLDENLTQLTQNQTLIAMLHFANESRPGDRNFDAPITRGGSPVFDQANITITEDAQPQNPVIVGDSPATNTDDDELLEDVNGDGEADFDDAIDLAFNTEAASENVDAFDFDGDGDVDFDDAIELAFE